MDLKANIDQYLTTLSEAGKSFNTIKNYRTDLKCFNDYWINKKKTTELKEFQTLEVQEYALYLDKKYDSENSKRRRVQALRLFFDDLVKRRVFPDNPVRKIPVFAKVLEAPSPVPFTIIQKMINDFNEKKETSLLVRRNLVLIALIYGAGLKVSDISRLKKRHLINTDHLFRVMVSPPKRDPYSIPLNEYWSSVIKDYLEHLKIAQDKSQMHFEDFLFNANAYQILSGGLSARGIELIFNELSTQYKYKMTARDLRQSCIFKWILMQVPNSTIKERMGVKPNYSLKPFTNLIKENPSGYAFNEL